MNNKIEDNLLKSTTHLSTYLNALHESAKQKITINSRWPGKGKIVCKYPKNFTQHLVLFFKTLNFSFLKEAQRQLLDHAIESLRIYKEAIVYESLSSKPQSFYYEQQILTSFSVWLKNLSSLDDQLKFSEDQKEEILEWAGRLDDYTTSEFSVPLRALLKVEFQQRGNAMNQLNEAVENRLKSLPELIDQAIAQAEKYFQGTEFTKIHSNQVIASKVDSLFNFFVTEIPRPEMKSVYKQVKLASKVWEKIKQEKSFNSSDYQQKLDDFSYFFQKFVEHYGPARDLTNGIAYADLFSPSIAKASKIHAFSSAIKGK